MQKLEDKNLEARGIYKGILASKKKKENAFKSEIRLLEGVQDMTYKGIKIRKNANGVSWFARFRKNKKQYYVSEKTQLGCYNKVKDLYNAKVIVTKTKNTTLYEWYQQWLELYKKDVKQSTIMDYSASLKYLEDLKNQNLDKITSINILETLNKINFERRKQKVYELLKDLFTKALNNEIIDKNPIDKLERPKHKRKIGSALSNIDEHSLEKVFLKHNADVFLVALYQGLRKGEVLALTISDFDFKNKTLAINKSINLYNEVDTTKNESSTRVMPLFDKTIKIMQKYKNTKGRIFDLSPKQCQTLFLNLISEIATKEKYTIHSLRHTFITKCQEKKIPLHIIQHWCGHVQGSKVTNEVYTHTRKEAELLYINIIND